jgi:cyclic pyranopterin phosphate synthase
MPAPDQDDRRHHLKAAKFLDHSELLSYEELLRVVQVAVGLGMNKIRLTGGEPLVRRGVINFIKALSGIGGLDQIRLTTNGLLLGEHLEPLFTYGVRHINVSLDTLQKEKYQAITGRDCFVKVWQALDSAEQMGFSIKINVVAMKGINDDEFADFAKLALDHAFQVRFIEFMPVGEDNHWSKKRFVGSEDIQRAVRALGELTPLAGNKGDGPARVYQLQADNGREGRLGFISPISHHFCDKCNRLRLTSEGRLRACLLRETETDLRALLRGGATDEQLREAIRLTILNKPKGHCLEDEKEMGERASCSAKMSRIGG